MVGGIPFPVAGWAVETVAAMCFEMVIPSADPRDVLETCRSAVCIAAPIMVHVQTVAACDIAYRTLPIPTLFAYRVHFGPRIRRQLRRQPYRTIAISPGAQIPGSVDLLVPLLVIRRRSAYTLTVLPQGLQRLMRRRKE